MRTYYRKILIIVFLCQGLFLQGCSTTKYTFHRGPVLSAEEYNDLGVAYEYSKEYQLAIDSYKRAIGANKTFFIAWMNLGNVYHEIGKIKNAEEAYQEALQINPASCEVKNNLAWLYIENKRNINLAVTLSEECASTFSEYQPYYLDTLGMAYYSYGDIAKAIATLTQATQLTSFEDKALLSQQYYHLGIIHLSSQEKDEALTYLKESIKSMPEGEWAKKAQEEINRLNTAK